MIIKCKQKNRFDLAFPFQYLDLENIQLNRGYVWIPLKLIIRLFLCVKIMHIKGELSYVTLLAYNLSNNLDYKYLRIYMTPDEILEMVCLDEHLNNLLRNTIKS